MLINSIDSQSFDAQRFRLPVKSISTRWWRMSVDCEKEFENPNAEMLYNKAKQTSNLKEKADLLYAMGHYRIVDKEKENLLTRFLKTVLP